MRGRACEGSSRRKSRRNEGRRKRDARTRARPKVAHSLDSRPPRTRAGARQRARHSGTRARPGARVPWASAPGNSPLPPLPLTAPAALSALRGMEGIQAVQGQTPGPAHSSPGSLPFSPPSLPVFLGPGQVETQTTSLDTAVPQSR